MEGNLNFLGVPKTRHEIFTAIGCVGMHKAQTNRHTFAFIYLNRYMNCRTDIDVF